MKDTLNKGFVSAHKPALNLNPASKPAVRTHLFPVLELLHSHPLYHVEFGITVISPRARVAIWHPGDSEPSHDSFVRNMPSRPADRSGGTSFVGPPTVRTQKTAGKFVSFDKIIMIKQAIVNSQFKNNLPVVTETRIAIIKRQTVNNERLTPPLNRLHTKPLPGSG